MDTFFSVFIKSLKIIAGIIIGLVLSFLICAVLSALLGDPNPFGGLKANLYVIGAVIAVCVFVSIWFLFVISFKRKIDTAGFDRLDGFVQEFIDSVIEAMKYSYKARCDVRQELTDHCIDALDSCKSDKEIKQEIQELIGEFGDPKLLGILSRRGKKRCRPLWQKILILTPQVVMACCLLFGLYVGWFFSGRPKIEVDYFEIWKQQVRPVADGSQNARPFYSEAVRLYNNDAIAPLQSQDISRNHRFDEAPRSLTLLSDDQAGVIETWVLDNSKTIELVRQGNEKPYYWGEYIMSDPNSTELLTILIPYLGDYKRLAYLLCWQGLLDADAERYDMAFDDICQSYVFGRQVTGQNNTLIEHLVGFGIKGIANRTLRTILYEHNDDIDAEQLDLAAKKYRRFFEETNMEIDLDGEMLFIRDEIQRSFVESWFGTEHVYLKHLSTFIAESGRDDLTLRSIFTTHEGLKILFHPGKRKTLESAERFYALMDENAKITPATRNALGNPVKQEVAAICRDNIFLNSILPSLSRIIDMSYSGIIDTHATLVVIALQQYKKQHSQYPTDLTELVKEGLIEDVPIDPFSDKPLVYRKIKDNFVLYSVGRNFADDGGVIVENKWYDKKGDAVFWPADAEVIPDKRRSEHPRY